MPVEDTRQKWFGRYGALLPLFRLVGALCIAALWSIHFWMMGRLLALFFALAPSIVLIININESSVKNSVSGQFELGG
jgi:hypothetical protein